MAVLIEHLRRLETWLDAQGFAAWIAALALSFLVFFPLGLAVLGYMIWSGRMTCCNRTKSREGGRRWRLGGRDAAASGSGNAAFDAYREQTLQRLEEEREAFAGFMERLRRAKDQAEFDQFMAERGAGQSPQAGQAPQAGPAPQTGPAPSGGAPPAGGQGPIGFGPAAPAAG